MCAAFSLDWATGSERGGPGLPEGGDVWSTADGQAAPPTILVVEDEFLVRLGVSDHLRHCGYRVLEARTGEEAQAILRAGELVEILFTDVNLGPGINGFELATWTRATYRDIRIIVTSGMAKMTQAAAGFCDRPLLNKPYSYATLAAHIKSLLGALGKRSGA